MLQGLYILYLQCPWICCLTLYKGSAHALNIRRSTSYFLSFCSSKSKTKYKMNKQRVLHVYTRKLLARVSFILHLILVQLYNISSLCLNFTGPTHYIFLFIFLLLSTIRRPLLYFTNEWTLGCNATAWFYYLYTLTKIYSNTQIKACHTYGYYLQCGAFTNINIFKFFKYLI